MRRTTLYASRVCEHSLTSGRRKEICDANGPVLAIFSKFYMLGLNV